MDVRRSIPPRRFPFVPLASAIGLALLLHGDPGTAHAAPAVRPNTLDGQGRASGVPNRAADALPLIPAPVPATLAAVLPDPWFAPGFDRPERLAATFTVTTAADTGAGSLRAAIVAANANPDLDLIAFAIPGGGVRTISPLAALPDVVQPVVIDGTTQPGYAGVPLIELSGALAGVAHGLALRGGGSTVRGLIINRWAASGMAGGNGIYIDNAGGNRIEGCYIGTNAAGTAPAPNGSVGIFVIGATSQNTIGGTTAAARNVISGNAVSGIALASGGAGRNLVRGNYIGVNAAGTAAVPNQGNGVFVNSPDDTIGGNVAGARNIISGNIDPGVFIAALAPRTVVLGNYVGTDVTGTIDLGNPANGITSGNPSVSGAPNAVIGDATPLGGNLISGNDFPGIYLLGAASSGARVQGNTIGLDVTRSTALGDGNGIVVDQANDVVIGGAAAGARNHVGGHPFAGIVLLSAARTTITGNVVGLGATPGPGLGNTTGIVVADSPNSVIGGAAPGEGNTIAGNTFYGISVRGAGSVDNRIVGNRIGTDGSAATNLGNALDGILIAASRTTIGQSGAGNVIAFNGRAGVYDSTGTDNAIRYNVLRGNGELGIDLLPRGLTKNDLLDADTGANGLINFPYLDSAFVIGNVRRVYGRMEGKPNTTYRIDLFRNEACDPRHFGEAQEHLGEATRLTDGAGNCSFMIDLPLPTVPPPTPYITATATDATGNTSELSQCLCLDDADGDGIMDCWETQGWGLDVNHDGDIDLDLYSRTARPDHKDVFVEVDAMAGFAPPPSALDMVVNAFGVVPNTYLANPDGEFGINLQIEVSDTTLALVSLPGPWAEFATIKDANFGTQAERDSPNGQHIRHAKRLVYRYALWARTFRDSSAWGVAEPFDSQAGGDDVLVTIETPQSDSVHAGVFMHELGHTFGLLHGGADTTNFKPNYYSVMNYMWQNPKKWQRPGSWRLDYSPVALASLNEASLDERVGMSVPAGVWPVTVSIPYGDPQGDLRWTKLRPNLGVDWNWNGSDRDVGVLANLTDMFITRPTTRIDVLTGHGDWSNLRYDFRRSRNFTLSGPSTWASSGPVLLAEDVEPELGPELNAILDALPPPRPEGWFVLDGQLDAGIPLVASNAGLVLHAAYRNGQLYVATQGAPAADVHVLVTSAPPGALQSAPRSKAGQVATHRALLAETGPPGLTEWMNAQGQDVSMIAVDSTNTFLEGVIDVELLDGALPAQLWVAVGRYGFGNGGALQAQVPAGNGDGNVDAAEFATIVVPVGVPGDPPAAPGPLALSAAWPNPTNGASRLRFRLPSDADVEATVHDVAGRRVAVLARGPFPAGEHDLAWSGRTAGRRAPAGVYFVTLEALGERRTTRIVLLP